jgi:hypothetical protein
MAILAAQPPAAEQTVAGFCVQSALAYGCPCRARATVRSTGPADEHREQRMCTLHAYIADQADPTVEIDWDDPEAEPLAVGLVAMHHAGLGGECQ